MKPIMYKLGGVQKELKRIDVYANCSRSNMQCCKVLTRYA